MLQQGSADLNQLTNIFNSVSIGYNVEFKHESSDDLRNSVKIKIKSLDKKYDFIMSLFVDDTHYENPFKEYVIMINKFNETFNSVTNDLVRAASSYPSASERFATQIVMSNYNVYRTGKLIICATNSTIASIGKLYKNFRWYCYMKYIFDNSTIIKHLQFMNLPNEVITIIVQYYIPRD
jgi:hypothetical protein